MTGTANYHHGRLRAALVEAACAALEQGGDEALSLRALAHAVGVSHNAPYRHFATRDHLVSAVAGEGFRRLTVALTGPTMPKEANARLMVGGRAYLALAQATPALYRLMFDTAVERREPDPGLAEWSHAAFEALRSMTAGVVGLDWPQERIGVASIAVWTQLHGLALLVADGKVKPWMLAGADMSSLVDAVMAGLPSLARQAAREGAIKAV